ncbi:MAG TPA: tRNA dihydrouridine synthase DusB, partial [Acidimicrobiales bacterium]
MDKFALRIGSLTVDPPVVLAPMAGVTNAPFRALCRRFGAGLYVSEMVLAAAVVHGNAKTARMTSFAPDESPRSIQLYGTDPDVVAAAASRLVDEAGVDHIDLNFGCPMPKVTRRGGGAAVPAKPRLLRRIVAAAVRAAGPVPVTMKFRVGLHEGLTTYVEAGRIGEGEGCAAVALHARTAEQCYSGRASWRAIASLKEAVTTIPVLGNGDIWVADDALAMLAATGADGVVVGRGCLGRPWLFRDLAD